MAAASDDASQLRVALEVARGAMTTAFADDWSSETGIQCFRRARELHEELSNKHPNQLLLLTPRVSIVFEQQWAQWNGSSFRQPGFMALMCDFIVETRYGTFKGEHKEAIGRLLVQSGFRHGLGEIAMEAAFVLNHLAPDDEELMTEGRKTTLESLCRVNTAAFKLYYGNDRTEDEALADTKTFWEEGALAPIATMPAVSDVDKKKGIIMAAFEEYRGSLTSGKKEAYRNLRTLQTMYNNVKLALVNDETTGAYFQSNPRQDDPNAAFRRDFMNAVTGWTKHTTDLNKRGKTAKQREEMVDELARELASGYVLKGLIDWICERLDGLGLEVSAAIANTVSTTLGGHSYKEHTHKSSGASSSGSAGASKSAGKRKASEAEPAGRAGKRKLAPKGKEALKDTRKVREQTRGRVNPLDDTLALFETAIALVKDVDKDDDSIRRKIKDFISATQSTQEPAAYLQWLKKAIEQDKHEVDQLLRRLKAEEDKQKEQLAAHAARHSHDPKAAEYATQSRLVDELVPQVEAAEATLREATAAAEADHRAADVEARIAELRKFRLEYAVYPGGANMPTFIAKKKAKLQAELEAHPEANPEANLRRLQVLETMTTSLERGERVWSARIDDGGVVEVVKAAEKLHRLTEERDQHAVWMESSKAYLLAPLTFSSKGSVQHGLGHKHTLMNEVHYRLRVWREFSNGTAHRLAAADRELLRRRIDWLTSNTQQEAFLLFWELYFADPPTGGETPTRRMARLEREWKDKRPDGQPPQHLFMGSTSDLQVEKDFLSTAWWNERERPPIDALSNEFFFEYTPDANATATGSTPRYPFVKNHAWDPLPSAELVRSFFEINSLHTQIAEATARGRGIGEGVASIVAGKDPNRSGTSGARAAGRMAGRKRRIESLVVSAPTIWMGGATGVCPLDVADAVANQDKWKAPPQIELGGGEAAVTPAVEDVDTRVKFVMQTMEEMDNIGMALDPGRVTFTHHHVARIMQAVAISDACYYQSCGGSPPDAPIEPLAPLQPTDGAAGFTRVYRSLESLATMYSHPATQKEGIGQALVAYLRATDNTFKPSSDTLDLRMDGETRVYEARAPEVRRQVHPIYVHPLAAHFDEATSRLTINGWALAKWYPSVLEEVEQIVREWYSKYQEVLGEEARKLYDTAGMAKQMEQAGVVREASGEAAKARARLDVAERAREAHVAKWTELLTDAFEVGPEDKLGPVDATDDLDREVATAKAALERASEILKAEEKLEKSLVGKNRVVLKGNVKSRLDSLELGVSYVGYLMKQNAFVQPVFYLREARNGYRVMKTWHPLKDDMYGGGVTEKQMYHEALHLFNVIVEAQEAAETDSAPHNAKAVPASPTALYPHWTYSDGTLGGPIIADIPYYWDQRDWLAMPRLAFPGHTQAYTLPTEPSPARVPDSFAEWHRSLWLLDSQGDRDDDWAAIAKHIAKHIRNPTDARGDGWIGDEVAGLRQLVGASKDLSYAWRRDVEKTARLVLRFGRKGPDAYEWMYPHAPWYAANAHVDAEGKRWGFRQLPTYEWIVDTHPLPPTRLELCYSLGPAAAAPAASGGIREATAEELDVLQRCYNEGYLYAKNADVEFRAMLRSPTEVKIVRTAEARRPNEDAQVVRVSNAEMRDRDMLVADRLPVTVPGMYRRSLPVPQWGGTVAGTVTDTSLVPDEDKILGLIDKIRNEGTYGPPTTPEETEHRLELFELSREENHPVQASVWFGVATVGATYPSPALFVGVVRKAGEHTPMTQIYFKDAVGRFQSILLEAEKASDIITVWAKLRRTRHGDLKRRIEAPSVLMYLPPAKANESLDVEGRDVKFNQMFGLFDPIHGRWVYFPLRQIVPYRSRYAITGGNAFDDPLDEPTEYSLDDLREKAGGLTGPVKTVVYGVLADRGADRGAQAGYVRVERGWGSSRDRRPAAVADVVAMVESWKAFQVPVERYELVQLDRDDPDDAERLSTSRRAVHSLYYTPNLRQFSRPVLTVTVPDRVEERFATPRGRLPAPPAGSSAWSLDRVASLAGNRARAASLDSDSGSESALDSDDPDAGDPLAEKARLAAAKQRRKDARAEKERQQEEDKQLRLKNTPHLPQDVSVIWNATNAVWMIDVKVNTDAHKDIFPQGPGTDNAAENAKRIPEGIRRRLQEIFQEN